MKERRKHVRFLVKDNLLVEVEGRKFNDFGTIKDISMGGLVFNYISDKKLTRAIFTTERIILFPKGVHLFKVPCKIAYDIPARTPYADYIRPPFITKRCGVQFEALIKNQSSRLKSFIRNNAKALSP